MKKFSIISIVVLLVLGSCQRSDICSETTPTTPRLVIKFYDFQNPDSLKAVNNFNAKTINSPNFYYNNPKTDTVVMIPLRTDKNFTNYEFVINQYDSTAQTNSDTLKFSYAPKAVYVSRACGYKTEFLEFNASAVHETDNSNWVKSVQVQQPNDIIDEQTTHLYIYH